MRKSGDFRYRWTLDWHGPVYRGRYREVTWRQVWWVPVLILLGPVSPALLALAVYWLLRAVHGIS